MMIPPRRRAPSHGWPTATTPSRCGLLRSGGSNRNLRVINATSRRGPGWDAPHRDMEIVSYAPGSSRAQGSMGTGSVIRPRRAARRRDRCSAQRVQWFEDRCSPFPPDSILPKKAGIAPGYEQRPSRPREARKLRLVASNDGRGERDDPRRCSALAGLPTVTARRARPQAATPAPSRAAA